MVEVAVAMSMASSAYNAIKKGMEMGREAQDVAEFFGKWFDAKEDIAEANQYAKNPSIVGKLFTGKSVEHKHYRSHLQNIRLHKWRRN